ncbi:hypothetical protein KIN20_007194 [Parelaphostrongylus tenuis]|uniref:Proteasome activator complex subunit 4 C-terminal domain-containing protein n=1 Tax=Parelaphostrongylus tenuis TaxID=148309 RepID=A0AAD5QJU5_PARTN|nr:hypothetical protein KIN20_007194 [Parelaphostrongylus tenuis]
MSRVVAIDTEPSPLTDIGYQLKTPSSKSTQALKTTIKLDGGVSAAEFSSKLIQAQPPKLVIDLIEVRREESRAMFTLIICEYLEVNGDLLRHLNNLMENKNLSTLHGALLGMSAVGRDHPFSIPFTIKIMLTPLCGVISDNAELQKATTTALREFVHRDNWEKVTKILGSDLVYKIENAIVPICYACCLYTYQFSDFLTV